jgi:acetylornithine/succinyldiaminopimelate/putrescine aminotransferase
VSALEATSSALMSTYPPQPVTFVRGSGSELWDADGTR